MTAAGLPDIPIIDADTPEALFDARREQARALSVLCNGGIPAPATALADRFARRWLARNAPDDLPAIDRIADGLGRPGGHMLNMIYEWSCTTGAAPDPSGEGVRLVRILDWAWPGLGQHLVTARSRGPAGPFLSATWPGAVGLFTGMAPGRFAAGLNQAPLRKVTGIYTFDIAFSWLRMWRGGGLPAALLLRQTFETARSYAEARDRLADPTQRVAVPAFFVLCGTRPGEACVIERLETDAVVHEGETAVVANDWLSPGLKGAGPSFPRGEGRSEADTRLLCAERRAQLTDHLRAPIDDLSWLSPPVLNRRTRVAAVANPATGDWMLQGWERGQRDGPPAVPGTSLLIHQEAVPQPAAAE